MLPLLRLQPNSQSKYSHQTHQALRTRCWLGLQPKKKPATAAHPAHFAG